MSSCDINSQVGESDVVPCCRVSGTFLVPELIKTVSAQKKLLVFSLGTKKHLLVLGCFFFISMLLLYVISGFVTKL